ncbi:tetratricopeptide repeat protein [Hyphococcus sp.]|uniref:tetratricopeptide repeat protein n=1 Tax=Hyphococcus sp. TaxID=2038636 RepID=UPI0020846F68|nr:MAG: hypothetical protein DHS20C04_06370 [Marinicaulis sp.]
MTTNLLQILQLAAARFQRGEFQAALDASEEALRQSPGHPEGVHMKALSLGKLGRVDEALPLFDQAASTHPQKHVILANKGNALRSAERYAEAIEAYEAAVSSAPDYIAGRINLGVAHWRAGDPGAAESVFRDAMTRAPNDPNLLNNFGVLLDDQARSSEAAEMFTAALALQPNMLFARVNRGSALRKIGRLDEALTDLGTAAKAAPGNAEIHYQHGNALRQAGALAEAESAFLRALSIAPSRADIHRDLARLLWEAGAGMRFIERLDAAIAAQPSAELLTLKSELAYLAAHPEAAEDAALKSLSVDPSGIAPRRTLGMVRSHRSDLPGAIKILEEALAMAPADFETIHALAEVLLGHGDHHAAARLLESDPPDEFLQRHFALKANAMRLSGDPEYLRFYDYDRFARKMFIEPPEGFADLTAFNDALVEAILPLHLSKTRPLEQTLYGGTQSLGRLWEEPDPVIQALKRQLMAAVDSYIDELPDDPTHPFLSKKSKTLTCAGSWSVVLSSGGGHVDHIHPKGWISASYYVRVPKEVLHSEKSGFLRLGASGLSGVKLEAERWYMPEEGAVVIFPSYMWHGVEPFQANTPRITAPFDLAPEVKSGV